MRPIEIAADFRLALFCHFTQHGLGVWAGSSAAARVLESSTSLCCLDAALSLRPSPAARCAAPGRGGDGLREAGDEPAEFAGPGWETTNLQWSVCEGRERYFGSNGRSSPD
jgi:hypothetical protein